MSFIFTSPDKNYINFQTPKQWFSNFTMHQRHPEGLLTQTAGPHAQKFRLRRSEVGPGNVHFPYGPGAAAGPGTTPGPPLPSDKDCTLVAGKPGLTYRCLLFRFVVSLIN